ncbi:MAG: hypothetical protein CYG61_11105 [Actinobacteria bacterium]|nr:MAG: hypothetical protein CYG61_11105 [Actinomycetota bacterium]
MSGTEEILRDLLDMILAEDLAGATSQAELRTPDGHLPCTPPERTLRVALPGGDSLALRVRSGHPRAPWRMSRPPILRLSPGRPARVLEPHDVLVALAERLPGGHRWPALQAVLRDLLLAPRRAEAAARVAGDCLAEVGARPCSLGPWERLTSLRDRPFHPTARVRSGWSDADHDRYGPEAAAPFPLAWVAVRREVLRRGPGASDPAHEAAGLLAPQETLVVRAAMQELGLDGGDHVALPVHPWQAGHVLAARLAEDLASGVCTPLAAEVGSFVATASVRTLASTTDAAVHVKLPLGVASLGALRLLPPRYLHNGGQGQALLAAVATANPGLGDRLRWCDESDWWVFDRAGVPEDVAGHLGCLLRRYPPDLAGDPGCGLVPLAALGVATPDGRAPALTHLSRLLARSSLDALEVVARALAEVALSCFAAGVMPEVHGQNVVLALRDGALAAIVLRDHDTVRVHLPWLRRRGLSPPNYVVASGTPNTLLSDTPEALLGWFQTLGVQVALAAAVEAEAAESGHDTARGWEAVAAGVADALGNLDLPPDARRVALRQLFSAPAWPAKLVLTPLLQRTGTGGGSMPSAVGESPNPLFGLGVTAQSHGATAR